MSSKKSSKLILPPTGFMLTSTLLRRGGGNYCLDFINEGINRDYKYGNNIMRSVCSDSNGVSRNYGESEFLRTELDSIEKVRDFAQRYQIPIKSLSNEAQRAINLGYVPEDKRIFHMKELDFDEEESPLVLMSKRRKSSLESKIGKTLERIMRYRKTEEGKRDSGFEKLKSSFSRLEEEFDFNLLSWRASRGTPFQMCDTCTTDFAAVTYLVNSNTFLEKGKIKELLNKDELAKRIDLVKSYSSKGGNRMIFNEKNNFESRKRDRAISFYTQNLKNNAVFETRIITPRDLIEATIGDRSHDGYKTIQRGEIEKLRRTDSQFAELVRISLDLVNCPSLNELYKK
ncbi:MAG: hypothetical protein ACMXYB_00455 [Candidatus Woesearchaeota archaeon]